MLRVLRFQRLVIAAALAIDTGWAMFAADVRPFRSGGGGQPIAGRQT